MTTGHRTTKTTLAIERRREELIQSVIEFLKLFMCETLAKRLVTLILLVAGMSDASIAELTGHAPRSTQRLKKKIRDDMPVKLILSIGSGKGRKSKAAGIEDQIVKEIESGEYTTKQRIIDVVKEKLGVQLSLSGLSRLQARNGIRKLKCGSIPAKANPEVQASFYYSVLKPLMDAAKAGIIHLFFLDGSHFIMGCGFLGHIWGKVRRFVKTFSGRKRYNVLGALDYVTKKVVTVSNDLYINMDVVAEMLNKLVTEYPGERISIILDNAAYQKTKVIRELAAALGIELVYLPPYSPNLNLIERLWKFVKGKLRTRYYDNFDEFKATIDDVIASTTKENKEQIETLIGEKVQLFDDLCEVTETTLAYAKNAA